MICWALVLSLPVMLPLTLYVLPVGLERHHEPAWIGLFYVSLFSMLIGFIFWYRGLAQGGIAAVGQLQLLQPFFGLVLAATLLHEPVSWPMIAVTMCGDPVRCGCQAVRQIDCVLLRRTIKSFAFWRKKAHMPFRRLDRAIRSSELRTSWRLRPIRMMRWARLRKSHGTTSHWRRVPRVSSFIPEIIARRLRPVMRCVARDNPRWPMKED